MQAVIDGLAPALEHLAADASSGLVGVLTLRLTVGEDGRVLKIETLFDRLLPASREAADPVAAAAAAVAILRGATVPAADASSLVTVPVRFGVKLG